MNCHEDLRQQANDYEEKTSLIDDYSMQENSGNNVDSTPIEKKGKSNNSNPRSSANYILMLTGAMILLFLFRVANRGIDFGELLNEMNIGGLSLIVLVVSLLLSFVIYGLGIKLRVNVFENSEKYPMNDFYFKISKIYNFGMSRNIPEEVGFFEVASITLLNMFPVIVLSTLATWNIVWGFPFKFLIIFVSALISIIIFVSFMVFPDKVNKLFKDDIRSENGFKKYFLVSKIPLLLMLLGVYIHLFV